MIKLGAASLLGTLAAGCAPAAIGKASSKPKNIIFMVSDGMSLGVPSLAEHFSRLVRGKGTAWRRLAENKSTAQGFFDMASLDSIVTDSAAASSSWSSGSRVANGFLNYLPDHTRLAPIGALVKESGRAFGFATTATVTHATPAGFTVSLRSRESQDDIAEAYLEGTADVMLGGGLEYFDRDARSDDRDLFGDLAAKGYTVAKTSGELGAASQCKKFIGVFNDGYLPYTIDHRRDAFYRERIPTLREMSLAAIQVLSQNPRGYLLQIEGARIDHAAHNNDPAAILWDQLAFDDALEAVLAYASQRNDTLVVVTSDHGNSNPGLIGTARRYALTNEYFLNLPKITGSLEQIKLDLKYATGKAEPTEQDLATLFQKHTSFSLTSAESDRLWAAYQGNFKKMEEVNIHQNSLPGIYGQILSNHTSVGWNGTQHSSDLTSILATGPGQDLFHGLIKNTEAFVHMTSLFGINHTNKSMDPEIARPLLIPNLESDRAHWEQVRPKV